MKYSGERLVRDNIILQPMRIENLARFNYFMGRITGGLILDLGCGVGEGTIYLSSNKNWKVFGVDKSFPALIVGSKRKIQPNLDFFCMNGLKLAFTNEVFDGVISVEVIEHLGNPSAFLDEVFRVLKPGGTFFLTTPNRLISSPNRKSLWPDHEIEYSPSELLELLQTRFPICEIFGEYIPVFENNYFRKIVHKLAPFFKPRLPKWARIYSLPLLQTIIKSNLKITDVIFTKLDLDLLPTIVAICSK